MDYPPDTFDLCVVVGWRGLSGLLSSREDPEKIYDYSLRIADLDHRRFVVLPRGGYTTVRKRETDKAVTKKPLGIPKNRSGRSFFRVRRRLSLPGQEDLKLAPYLKNTLYHKIF